MTLGTGRGPLAARRAAAPPPSARLVDGFGRVIDYLRVSLTDRCNFRCFYCMSEDVEFLPKADVLSLDEMDRLCSAFVGLGVRRLRLTGGEPLARRNVLSLVRGLSRHLAAGTLDEITMTTNGSLLARHAAGLAAAGMRRINVSLDTLDAQAFAAVTRLGRLDDVLAGIDAALAAGLRVKLNTVVMRGINDGQLDALVDFAHGRGMDLTLIEVMPIGAVDGDRGGLYLPLSAVRAQLARRFTLDDIPDRMAGPARYVRLRETGGRLGFVTPMSDRFCAGCNRVRVTCTGQLAPCLGREDSVDLRAALRAAESDGPLVQAIGRAIAMKPAGHALTALPAGRPAVARPMSMTGG